MSRTELIDFVQSCPLSHTQRIRLLGLVDTMLRDAVHNARESVVAAYMGETVIEEDSLTPSQTPSIRSSYEESMTLDEYTSPSAVSDPVDLRPITFNTVLKKEGKGAIQHARYSVEGMLGKGGSAEVWLAQDKTLNRTVALKVIRSEVSSEPRIVSRFIEEAQMSSQLEHPGIMPVYDMGRLEDGRNFFTMQVIRGRTFTEVIKEVHAASSEQQWNVAPSGWNLRRLIDAFRRVCEAVAYAHRRHVIHRDLKPHNIMIGTNGEVFVVDWGLAKVVRPESAKPSSEEPERYDQPIVTLRDAFVGNAFTTQHGVVAGTPAYMPPEQAAGLVDKLDFRTDVYSLGAILYEVLSRSAPYVDPSISTVIDKISREDPKALSGLTKRPLPEELVEACERAMSRDPNDRHQDAGELASVITEWLEGTQRRIKARGFVEEAQARLGQAEVLRGQAQTMEVEAKELLSQVKSWEAEEKKLAGWEVEDQAQALKHQAALTEFEAEQSLYSALTHAPDFADVHEALAKRYTQLHKMAQLERDTIAAARAELNLATHALSLPDGCELQQHYLDYLEGEGSVSLVTNPAVVDVELYKYSKHHRRLVLEHVRSLGQTPLSRFKLPMGSYLLKLSAPGYDTVHYPVHIERQDHWHGVPSRAGVPGIVDLPKTGDFQSETDCYVPPGWFQAGEAASSSESFKPHQAWVDGFVIKRYSVTNREYIAFLDALVESGLEDEALKSVPRERSGSMNTQGAMLYGRDAAGKFVLQTDSDGDVWQLDWPVLYVDWHNACRYAQWLAEKTGIPWRLPFELEWEKAARGVDGRLFPYGDFLDPSWVCMRFSHEGQRMPSRTHEFPLDKSPYGVRGMGGNAMNWCLDRPNGLAARIVQGADGEQSEVVRVYRGGAWFSSIEACRATRRFHSSANVRSSYVGIRVCASWPPSDAPTSE